ncbi:MAG: hypothetical protein V9H69_13760 [Anaerolineae bacterium]
MPYQTLWRRPAGRTGRLALLLAAMVLLAACSRDRATPAGQPAAAADSSTPAAAAQPPQPQPVDALKLVVDQPGLYRVTAAELAAAGFDAAAGDPALLTLTLDDQPVTLTVEGSSDALALTFYGTPPRQPLWPGKHLPAGLGQPAPGRRRPHAGDGERPSGRHLYCPANAGRGNYLSVAVAGRQRSLAVAVALCSGDLRRALRSAWLGRRRGGLGRLAVGQHPRSGRRSRSSRPAAGERPAGGDERLGRPGHAHHHCHDSRRGGSGYGQHPDPVCARRHWRRGGHALSGPHRSGL